MAGDDEVRIERVIAVPRALLFELWSRPEHLERWFAPDACTLVVHAFEFAPGGELRTTIRAPDGSTCDAVSTYREIVPGEKIVYTISATKGDEWPEETTVTVTFSDRGDGTLLTVHQTVPEWLAKRTGAYPSWLQMLDRLSAQAAGPELFFHPLASYCHKVLIALYENETRFVRRQVDLMDAASSAEFFALWPVGKMPVLRHGTRVIPEASLILEYLDAAAPGPVRLLPEDPDARLDVRLWDRFFDLYVQTPMQKIVTDRLRVDGEGDARGVEEAREGLRRAYDVLEARLADREWVVGHTFGMADCAAGPALFFAGVVEPFAASHPRVSRYFERLVARPSFARVIAEARPYFGVFPYREALPARFV